MWRLPQRLRMQCHRPAHSASAYSAYWLDSLQYAFPPWPGVAGRWAKPPVQTMNAAGFLGCSVAGLLCHGGGVSGTGSTVICGRGPSLPMARYSTQAHASTRRLSPLQCHHATTPLCASQNTLRVRLGVPHESAKIEPCQRHPSATPAQGHPHRLNANLVWHPVSVNPLRYYILSYTLLLYTLQLEHHARCDVMWACTSVVSRVCMYVLFYCATNYETPIQSIYPTFIQ